MFVSQATLCDTSAHWCQCNIHIGYCCLYSGGLRGCLPLLSSFADATAAYNVADCCQQKNRFTFSPQPKAKTIPAARLDTLKRRRPKIQLCTPDDTTTALRPSITGIFRLLCPRDERVCFLQPDLQIFTRRYLSGLLTL